jgi:hypothetical protein
VRRADGSGTSFIFTNYLSKVNAEWKARVGEGTAVNWPTGAGGKGNEGVAAFVGRLPNSIGYVEYAYVKQNKMTWAQMQNAEGQFVAPDDALQGRRRRRRLEQELHQILTNQPGKAAWPITGATFILMHKSQDKPAQAAAMKFFEWAYSMATDGDGAGLRAHARGRQRRDRQVLGAHHRRGGPAGGLEIMGSTPRAPGSATPWPTACLPAARAAALLTLALLLGILMSLLIGAWPAIERYGLSFLVRSQWDPVAGEFGGLVMIYGTLATSAIAC